MNGGQNDGQNIVIYGCGAIGSILATYIQSSPNESKHDVHLIGRKKIMTNISQNGLNYIPYDSPKSIKTSGFITHTSIDEISSADVIILTMKAYSLENSLNESKIASLVKESNPIFIIAMNGIGLREIVERYVPKNRIIEVSVGYPSRLEGNTVKNTGGNSFFSTDNGDFTQKTFNKIFGAMSEIPFRFDADFNINQWKKAIANIAMNGISAISMLTVGEVLERKSFRIIIKNLINEGVAVANEMGIEFGVNMLDWFMEFAGMDPNHKTSTLQDIIRGKKTEIGFMNGYIVSKGKSLGIETPANAALETLVKIIENKL